MFSFPMTSTYFQPNVQQVRFPTHDVRDGLRHGFILIDPAITPSSGLRVLAAVIPLLDDTFSVKCTYLDFREQAADGTHMHDMRDLGYLTQSGIDALRPHPHCRCNTQLELSVSRQL